MVWIPGGEFSMGAAVGGGGSCEMPMASNDADPVHRVYVDGFWMDATQVTNGQFEKFARATGYVTIAERTPTRKEFPTAPDENLVAGSVVFTPTDREVSLNDHLQWWNYVKGANWRHPLGPQSDIRKTIRLYRSLILTRRRMQNGLGNVSPPKRSLNLRHAAGCQERYMCGAMNFGLAESSWQTRGRENFQ
jgi:formylglycine-generating enzyme required for sulfatase activity